jgi:hypothetical protein
MRMRTAVGACASLLFLASTASAQVPAGEFGQRGQFIVSADRLFPLFSYTHFSQDAFVPGAGNTKQVAFENQTSISLLWGSASGPSVAVGSDAAAIQTFFTVPRVGVDYVLTHHVTVGGDVAIYFTLGGDTGADSTTNAGAVVTNSTGNPSVLVLGIAPRGGYILPLTDMFSLWLRGGFSYFVASSKTTTGAGAGAETVTTTTNQFALDLDPQLVITPFPHVGFTAGVTTDLPLTGGHSQDTTPANGGTTTVSAASSVLYFGITGGMLVYF